MQSGCIISEDGLEGVMPEWAALWRRVPDATPFQSPTWLMAWWRWFGNRAPRLLTLHAGGELRAILPLYLLNEGGCRKLLPIGIGLSDYVDALIDPECRDGA